MISKKVQGAARNRNVGKYHCPALNRSHHRMISAANSSASMPGVILKASIPRLAMTAKAQIDRHHQANVVVSPDVGRSRSQ